MTDIDTEITITISSDGPDDLYRNPQIISILVDMRHQDSDYSQLSEFNAKVQMYYKGENWRRVIVFEKPEFKTAFLLKYMLG